MMDFEEMFYNCFPPCHQIHKFFQYSSIFIYNSIVLMSLCIIVVFDYELPTYCEWIEWDGEEREGERERKEIEWEGEGEG